jgi:branched-chain amino acid transport system permease protein
MAQPTFNPGKFWATRVGSVVAAAGLMAALQFGVLPYLNSYDVRLLMLGMLFAILAVSLNIINGITGQFSIGHAAFYMVGAYTAGKLTTVYYNPNQGMAGWLWLIVMVVAAALTAAFTGLIVGLPSLRLKGDYLAIVTLGFGEIARIVVQNQDGGKQAIFGLDLGGAYSLKVGHKLTEVSYVALLLIIAIAVGRNLLKTAHGLSFLSVREDELASSAVGVNTTKTKVTAFIIGAAFAGMAGAMFALFNSTVSPDDFKMDVSFLVVAMVVIGGTGSITGAAVAGLGLKLFEEVLRKFSSVPAVMLLGYALVTIVVVAVAIRLKPFKIVDYTPALRAPTAIVGMIGCLGLAYAAYLNLFSSVSPVIKFMFIGLSLIAVVSLLFTRARASLPKFGLFLICVVAVWLLQIPVTAMLQSVPLIKANLGETTYTPSDLRWAVYAMSLVVVMLVRPQGFLGHHEFSWDFLKGAFRGIPPKPEVSA